MNIPKAIEINETILDGTFDHRDADMDDAIQLGIEALNFYRLLKAAGGVPPDCFLKGETEE